MSIPTAPDRRRPFAALVPRVLVAVIAAAGLHLPAAALVSWPAPEGDPRYALTVHGGRLASNDWEDFLVKPQRLDTVDATLVGVALARTLRRRDDGRWSIEVEGQVVRHFGAQRHWEFDLPLVLRWHGRPWREVVQAGAAFGLGLSFANEVPQAEIAIEGGSRRTMVHWFLEANAGPPGARWSAVIRLHHRSTGYGLFGSTGGANALTAGLKWTW